MFRSALVRLRSLRARNVSSTGWHQRIAPILLVALILGGGQLLLAQVAELNIDVASRTGPILHGASGWLYGQAAPGIPTINIMEPLRPRISAQKPAGGLQHPAGDALLVAPDYRAAGGQLLQIYMQDIYPDWTYNNLGIEDYLAKVDAITCRVARDPNHDLFVYVPFNEPNNNWYADTGPKFTKFLEDWTLVYRRIRALDPTAKIAGPGFEHFNGVAFETFLAFARDHRVLPDEFTWHELHDDFFPEWYHRVDAYRASEKKLGIGPLPIVINEYARDKGDLAVPGQLVQWIARLENSKVYGCLAFWTPSGTLADLAARIWPNRPTGAWWLYAWYGSMTGDTVRVTPPSADTPGLQGIATVDDSRQQVRAVFGGTTHPIRLKVLGLADRPGFNDGVHVTLARIRSSGVEPSPEPETVESSDRPLSGASLEIDIPAAGADAAYLLAVTPRWSAHPADAPGGKLAVLADLGGQALPIYGGETGPSVSLTQGDSLVRFLASVDHDGYYRLRLRYARAVTSTHKGQSSHVMLKINDETAGTLALPAPASKPWAAIDLRVFLAAGVNRFAFSGIQGRDFVALGSLQVDAAEGQITTYEAESPANTLRGTAHTISAAAAAGGSGRANTLQFNSVAASSSGRYRVIVTYANAEKGRKGQVEETASILVNGQPAGTTWFRNTFSDDVFATTTFPVVLKAGKNTIRFANSVGHAPVIDRIQIAQEPDVFRQKVGILKEEIH